MMASYCAAVLSDVRKAKLAVVFDTRTMLIALAKVCGCREEGK
jgi:hypothetical protein